MTAHDIRIAADVGASLGECPVWSVEEQCLYWIDIDGRTVHRHRIADPDEAVELPGRPGSIMLTAEPGVLVVAMEHELVRLDWATGATTPLTALEEAGTGNRLNDGRCDPAGRIVVGSMFADTGAGRRSGVLHQVHGADRVDRIRADIGVSNGLAFDPDRGRMYFADTPTDEVWVYDYDHETGAVGDGRLFLDYTALEGRPDGACVDAEGFYWSASVYGWAVIRVSPEGEVVERIDVPVEKPSMPAFGGAELSTLFITTIGAGGTTPSAPGRDGFVPGSLLAVDVAIEGRPEPRSVLS